MWAGGVEVGGVSRSGSVASVTKGLSVTGVG